MTLSPFKHPLQLETLQPLIILGMHRSGTSMTVRLLSDLGIFMGRWLSRDDEAVYFQRLNRIIYNSVQADWSNIDQLLGFIHDQKFITQQTNMLKNQITGEKLYLFGYPGLADFFGLKLYRKLDISRLPAWGWKDPRTTLTFPIWLNIFPNAKWLHIIRNGIDVAISIHRRSLKQQKKIRNRIFPIDYKPITLDFTYCFRLWEKYITFTLENKHLIPSDRYLEIQYEKFLEEPQRYLNIICDFINYPLSETVVETAVRQVNRARLDNQALALKYKDLLPSLASSPVMKSLGYEYPTL